MVKMDAYWNPNNTKKPPDQSDQEVQPKTYQPTLFYQLLISLFHFFFNIEEQLQIFVNRLNSGNSEVLNQHIDYV